VILGIDFGISTTDVVLLDNCRSRKSFSLESKSLSALKKAIAKNKIDLDKVDRIAVTGAKPSQKILFKKPISVVSEINAIGFGGAKLSKSKNCIVVSLGTGTCVVSFKGGRAKHVGGTGVGGGTVLGLSKRLVGISDVEKLSKLASKGSLKKTNLTVGEAIGGSVGIVPASATASNFAKLTAVGKADAALAVQNMVGEVVAIVAVLATKGSGQKKMVFVGKTATFSVVRKAIRQVLSYYGFSPVFPKGLGQATALGAAVFQANCFK
jgi:type II pantothenate kinase